jgi:hypothetical protein
MKETELQNKIRCALSEFGTVIRMNSGVFLTENGNHVRNGIPGMPDLLFVGDCGRTAWIEVKTEKGKVSKQQEQFIQMLLDNGHRAGVARSVDEALKIAFGTIDRIGGEQ